MASSHPCIPSYYLPSWRIPPLIGQRSPDLPLLYACLGRNERFLLCSLWEYPFGERRLLASGEPTAKFSSGLGFIKTLLREGSSLVGGVRAARGRKPLGKSTVAIHVIFVCTYSRVYVNGHLHNLCWMPREGIVCLVCLEKGPTEWGKACCKL
jgi:hypothetical protein